MSHICIFRISWAQGEGNKLYFPKPSLVSCCEPRIKTPQVMSVYGRSTTCRLQEFVEGITLVVQRLYIFGYIRSITDKGAANLIACYAGPCKAGCRPGTDGNVGPISICTFVIYTIHT